MLLQRAHTGHRFSVDTRLRRLDLNRESKRSNVSFCRNGCHTWVKQEAETTPVFKADPSLQR